MPSYRWQCLASSEEEKRKLYVLGGSRYGGTLEKKKTREKKANKMKKKKEKKTKKEEREEKQTQETDKNIHTFLMGRTEVATVRNNYISGKIISTSSLNVSLSKVHMPF